MLWMRTLLSWEEIRTVLTTCRNLAGETGAETMTRQWLVELLNLELLKPKRNVRTLKVT